MNKNALFGLLVLMILSALAISGCAKPSARCTSPEDNPQHHYVRGMTLLEEGDIQGARAKLERSAWCDEKYGPAYGGLAIIDAMATSAQSDPEYRKIDLDNTIDRLNRARKYSDTGEENFAYRVASMRVYTELKTRKWINRVEDDYKKAMGLKLDERGLLYYEGREAAIYFMAVAYIEAHRFEDARVRFADALNAKKAGIWNIRADEGWKKADKIVRATAGITLGDVGSEIAVKDSVRRDDMAALLVDELKVDRLFAGRIPVKTEIDKRQAEFTPADITDNPFNEEILTLMKWDIRGLEPTYDEKTRAYLFKPGEPVTRKELALVLEDVLIKLTGDESISKAFFGHEKSPFPDVPATSAWYNAVMNVTTRNIMETDLSGEFRPEDVVDGAEAILAIRVLRQRLNIY